MPSRIIREGFVDSEAVCALDDWAHRVYSNLLLKVDDAGRYDARLEILRSHLFPLGTKRRAQEFEPVLDQFESAAVAFRYHFAGKPYIQVTRWHRTGNSCKSKFPWKDGSSEIHYVTLDTKDGPKQFVFTSIPPPGMGSGWDTDGVPTPPNNEIRNTNSETRGSAEGVPVAQVQQALNISAAANNLSDKAIGIYEAYPRKVSKPEALKAILKCFKKVEPERLLELTKQYAGIVADWPESERQYVPYPTTWFNQERFSDDPKTWLRGNLETKGRIPPHRGGNL
jgi:hypothetical protein